VVSMITIDQLFSFLTIICNSSKAHIIM
jgi:hypothetical protein